MRPEESCKCGLSQEEIDLLAAEADSTAEDLYGDWDFTQDSTPVTIGEVVSVRPVFGDLPGFQDPLWGPQHDRIFR